MPKRHLLYFFWGGGKAKTKSLKAIKIHKSKLVGAEEEKTAKY